MIELKNVSKWYGPVQVLNECSATISKGEVVVVCGPSGSGKSTLIKTINALEPFQKGEITVDGIKLHDPKTNLPKLRSRVGMVFQHFELFPHLSVTDNLTIAQIKVLGRTADDAKTRGLKMLERVGDIIGEITAAASEQSAGIGQVNQSVAEIDRMTQQNAALVEESAAAAESLREQAARLSQVVQQFRLADSIGFAGHGNFSAPAPQGLSSPSSAPRALLG